MIINHRSDRRIIIRSKVALSPKEAALICCHAHNKNRVDANDMTYLLPAEAQILAGPLWEKKLQRFSAQYQDDALHFCLNKIRELGLSPMSARRLTLLFCTHFKGGQRAENYIVGRKKQRHLPQNIPVPLHTVEQSLGPWWERRLAAVPIITEQDHSENQPVVLFPITEVWAFIKEPLKAQIIIDTTRQDRRSPYSQ